MMNVRNKIIASLRRCQANNSRNWIERRHNQTSSIPIVFNRKTKLIHRDRIALAQDAHIYDYVRDHVARDVCDRVKDLKLDGRKLSFLDVGSSCGLVAKHLDASRVEALLEYDSSANFLKRSKQSNSMLLKEFPITYVQGDEEVVELEGKLFDLAISNLSLHWVNDLPSCFRRIHRCLRPDSAFMGAIFGGDTLYELRSSLQLAELERLSGFSPHVSPMTTGQDLTRLLGASGFQLITADVDELIVNYPSMFELLFDLQGMGENSATINSCVHLHRDSLLSAAAIYQQAYGDEENAANGIPATFQILHFIGWTPKETNIRKKDS